MVQPGSCLTVIVLLQVLLQPLESVTVTEYVPPAFTVIHCVVAPVLHEYAESPAGAQSCVALPWQMVVLPVMLQLGSCLTVTVLLQVLLQPLESVTITE